MSWAPCECEFCYCTNLAHSTKFEEGESEGESVICDSCEMGEHEADDDPEA